MESTFSAVGKEGKRIFTLLTDGTCLIVLQNHWKIICFPTDNEQQGNLSPQPSVNKLILLYRPMIYN